MPGPGAAKEKRYYDHQQEAQSLRRFYISEAILGEALLTISLFLPCLAPLGIISLGLGTFHAYEAGAHRKSARAISNEVARRRGFFS